jgi:hypothetical protein
MPSNTPNLNIPKLTDTDNFNTTTLGAIVDAIDQNAAKKSDLTTHQADGTSHVKYAVATGNVNWYDVSIPNITSYYDGFAISIKIPITNDGDCWLNVSSLGAKKVIKSNGSNIPPNGFKAGSIYTVRYNADAFSGGGAFILQGEGGEYGTADAPQVLQGYTVGKETGIVSGSMPNIGNNWQIAKTVQGYHDGSTGRILLKPPLGYYNEDTECRVYADDPDFHPNNFLSTVNVFGLQGAIPLRNGAGGNGGAPHHWLPNEIWADPGVIFMRPCPVSGSPPIAYQGDNWLKASDPDFIAANIKAGVNIFNMVGTFDGKRMATGSQPTIYFTGEYPQWRFTGLSFQPKFVMLYTNNVMYKDEYNNKTRTDWAGNVYVSNFYMIENGWHLSFNNPNGQNEFWGYNWLAIE